MFEHPNPGNHTPPPKETLADVLAIVGGPMLTLANLGETAIHAWQGDIHSATINTLGAAASAGAFVYALWTMNDPDRE